MPRHSLPKVTGKNYKTASLEVYQSEVEAIWGRYITERPALLTWLHVVDHASAACEGVRKREWNIVLEEVGTVLVWWLAFIAKLNALQRQLQDNESTFSLPFSPSEIIWTKYPQVCPVEFGLHVKSNQGKKRIEQLWLDVYDRPCGCLARKKEVEHRSPAEKEFAKECLWKVARAFSDRRPRAICRMEEMLRRFFSPQAYVLSVDEIAFHFMEEVGEVSVAIVNASKSKALRKPKVDSGLIKEERKQAMRSLVEELADVFSWAVTLVNKVRLEFSSFEKYFMKSRNKNKDDLRLKLRELLGQEAKRINLGDILWKKYGDETQNHLRCSACNVRECRCGEMTAVFLRPSTDDQHQRAIQVGLRNILRELGKAKLIIRDSDTAK